MVKERKALKLVEGGSSSASEARARQRFARTRRDHASETAEDYVELIDDLTREHGEARLVDIARHLGITHVAVNRTVSRLQREGLVHTRPYRSIFLTDEGKNLANSIRERHQLVVRFLCALGVSTEQAMIDAEGIEHHVSEELLRAMQRFLDKKG